MRMCAYVSPLYSILILKIEFKKKQMFFMIKYLSIFVPVLNNKMDKKNVKQNYNISEK